MKAVNLEGPPRANRKEAVKDLSHAGRSLWNVGPTVSSCVHVGVQTPCNGAFTMLRVFRPVPPWLRFDPLRIPKLWAELHPFRILFEWPAIAPRRGRNGAWQEVLGRGRGRRNR